MALIKIPNFQLAPGPITDLITSFGIHHFHQAIEWVWKLPYGRNSDRTNFLLLPIERKGTCSTKHAFLAAIAKEQKIPLYLNIGMFMMSEENTPGVGAVLSNFQLAELPEAHCYLKYDEMRFDFTFYKNKQDCVPKLIFKFEEEILPYQIGDFKNDLHKDYLVKWAEDSQIRKSLNELWLIREKCISAISVPAI